MSGQAAVVVAAGASTRMGAGPSKPWRELEPGCLVVERSLQAFERAHSIARVLLVVAAAEREQARSLVARFTKLEGTLVGGARRQDSVHEGVKALEGAAEVVVIHDAARPLIEARVIDEVVREATEHGAAIAASPIVDSIKEAEEGFVVRSVDRSRLYAAQTPQACRLELLREALELAERSGLTVTDEAQAMELVKARVRVVSTDRWNLKITVDSDLRAASALARRQDA